MCFDGLDEIGKVVAELQQHYFDKRTVETSGTENGFSPPLTTAEFLLIINRRIETSESRLRELGFEPKKRVQEGDFAKQAKENGITLPGQIPGAD